MLFFITWQTIIYTIGGSDCKSSRALFPDLHDVRNISTPGAAAVHVAAPFRIDPIRKEAGVIDQTPFAVERVRYHPGPSRSLRSTPGPLFPRADFGVSSAPGDATVSPYPKNQEILHRPLSFVVLEPTIV